MTPCFFGEVPWFINTFYGYPHLWFLSFYKSKGFYLTFTGERMKQITDIWFKTSAVADDAGN